MCSVAGPLGTGWSFPAVTIVPPSSQVPPSPPDDDDDDNDDDNDDDDDDDDDEDDSGDNSPPVVPSPTSPPAKSCTPPFLNLILCYLTNPSSSCPKQGNPKSGSSTSQEGRGT